VNNNLFTESFPVTREHKMSLLKEAQRVAAEFDYPAKDVNRGVKEFMREMGMIIRSPPNIELCVLNLLSAEEGLQNVGSTMSQIPTYVTAVPNGTEKVWIIANIGTSD